MAKKVTWHHHPLELGVGEFTCNNCAWWYTEEDTQSWTCRGCLFSLCVDCLTKAETVSRVKANVTVPRMREYVRPGCSFLDGAGHQSMYECLSCDIKKGNEEDWKEDHLTTVCAHCIDTCHKGHAVRPIKNLDTISSCMCGSYGCVENPLLDHTNIPLSYHDQKQVFMYSNKKQNPKQPVELPKGISESDALLYNEASGIFRAYDTDDSGALDRREFKKCMQILGHALPTEGVSSNSSSKGGSEGAWKHLFNIIDRDRSGEIDEREFCEYYLFSKKTGLILPQDQIGKSRVAAATASQLEETSYLFQKAMAVSVDAEDLDVLNEMLKGIIQKATQRKAASLPKSSANTRSHSSRRNPSTRSRRSVKKPDAKEPEESRWSSADGSEFDLIWKNGRIIGKDVENYDSEWHYTGKYSRDGKVRLVCVSNSKIDYTTQYDGTLNGNIITGIQNVWGEESEWTLTCISPNVPKLEGERPVALTSSLSGIRNLVSNWKPDEKVKLVLSLDGGGIRGVKTLAFLVQLEAVLGKPLPEVFHLLAGTSTGAIQAGLIGGLGYSAAKAFELTSLENFELIFPKAVMQSGLTSPKYVKGKSGVIKTFFGDKKMSDCVVPVVIPIFNVNKDQAMLINPIDHPSWELAAAIDASSAAPVFFPAVSIGRDWYIDGGVFANDPAMVAYIEAKQRWPNHDIRVLSIGTGVAEPEDDKTFKDFGAVKWITKGNLIDVMLNSSLVSKQVESMLGINYVRCNANLLKNVCSREMDERTPANVNALKKLGEALFDRVGHRAVELITRERNVGKPAGSTSSMRLAASPNDPVTVYTTKDKKK